MTRALRGLIRVNRAIALLTMVGTPRNARRGGASRRRVARERPSYPPASSTFARGTGRYGALENSVSDSPGGRSRAGGRRIGRNRDCASLTAGYFFAGGAALLPGAAAAGAGPAETLPLRSPEWPWNVRVGANSPSLCPTMFSVTNTGTNFRPLWTAKVSPTESGVIVLRRDQVLMTFLLCAAEAAAIFSARCPSTNGPFFTE